MEEIDYITKLLNANNIKTKVVNLNDEPYEVYIGRGSKWGNPFTHVTNKTTLAKYIVPTRDEAIESYRNYIEYGEGKHLLKDLHELDGKILGCFCKPKSCHGDILIELIKKYKD